MGKSVQFKNVDDVLTAYESRGVACFAIFQDKQFLFKFEGGDIGEGAAYLSDLLEILKGSAAIYTLAVYEDPGGRITSKTPYDGSFNFRFNENTEGYNQGSLMIRELRDEMRLLHERIENLTVAADEDDEGPQESETAALDRIAGYMNHPVINTLIQNILPMLTNNGAHSAQPQPQPQPQPAAINGAPGSLIDVQISRDLYSAITAMLSASKDAERRLIQLGKVAAENPGKFARLLMYVDLA